MRVIKKVLHEKRKTTEAPISSSFSRRGNRVSDIQR